MFIPEQFTRAKIWRQPTCPSTEEWVKKIWYTHTHTHTHNGILHSYTRNEKMTFATTWKDLEIIILNEISQRKTNTI